MNHVAKVELLLLGIVALTWRLVAYLHPSVSITIVGIFLMVSLAIFYVKHIPMARQTLRWGWLVLIGAGLNFAAIIGNGGQMPYPHFMSSVWWVWLGDWLPMGFSPGDILIIIGFLGIAIKLIATHRTLAYEK